jgi:hypothetical protein
MRVHPGTPPENEADAACRVCGEVKDLTFEHFPPRSAGNRQKVEMLDITAWLRREDDGSMERGRILQKGSGAYSLCEDCNNRSGRLYVPELAKWTRIGNAALGELDLPKIDGQVEPTYAVLEIKDVRPGRFLKQMATMFLALTSGGVAQKHVDLREYARNPEVVGLPPQYQFYLALNAGPNARYNGGSVTMTLGAGMVFALELSFPPFAYILSINEETPAIETGNITSFADVHINQTANVKMQLKVGFTHTAIPLDLRSKAALDKDIAANEAAAADLAEAS